MHQLVAGSLRVEFSRLLATARHTHKGEHWGKYQFVYQKDKNVYLCPQKHELTWKTTNRAGYREYWSRQQSL